MLYRFTVWGTADMPPGVVRHGISAEIEAPSYDQAVQLLKDGYANGRRQLVVGSVDQWEPGGAETIVALSMSRRDDSKEPS